ncbi:hypothetical protein [Falsiphaeobacter marinintestinus]|uniref:hypothetical protein n=1 Tax=Falsiphaeobacter marinintestinus TaxID=1492905 RepID=UPI0011B70B06|nr:hypothetical protein [Phaeobacter marinintestinus]
MTRFAKTASALAISCLFLGACADASAESANSVVAKDATGMTVETNAAPNTMEDFCETPGGFVACATLGLVLLPLYFL